MAVIDTSFPVSEAPRYVWYVVEVAPRREFTVEQRFREEGIAAFLPFFTRRCRRNRHSRAKVEVRLPVFPSYMFLAFLKGIVPPWRDIVSFRMVRGVLGCDGTPIAIRPHEVRHLARGYHSRLFGPPSRTCAGSAPQPSPFAPGDRVRFSATPLAGLAGKVLSISHKTVEVLPDIAGVSLPVHVGLESLAVN